MGYTRRMVRSTNYRNYIDKLFSVLKTFVHYKFFDIDTKKLLLGNCNFKGLEGWNLKNLITSLENKYIIANDIDNGNQEVIDFINEALTSGSSKNIGYGNLAAIFVSENKYKANNYAQYHYNMKVKSDFSKEMTRSVKLALDEWNGDVI